MPGSSVPATVSGVTVVVMMPVPASVPPVLTFMPAALLLPLSTTTPEVMLAWAIPVKLLP